MNMQIASAIPAQHTIKPKPAVALITIVTCSTIRDKKNPKAYADISRKPVVTVSSCGKVSSAVKSILTGMTGTRQQAPSIMFTEIAHTFLVWKVISAIPMITKVNPAESFTIRRYL